MYDKEQALKLMADRGQVLQDSVGQFKDGFGGLVKINGEIRFLAVVAKESMFSKNGKETKLQGANSDVIKNPKDLCKQCNNTLRSIIRLNKVTMPKSKFPWNLSYSHTLSSTP